MRGKKNFSQHLTRFQHIIETTGQSQSEAAPGGAIGDIEINVSRESARVKRADQSL